jgi:SWI/SNF-related matrix-associated actin-dependent regulator 1 of chromatin subfamily A
MTTLQFNPPTNCYFAFNVGAEDAIILSRLLWKPHPDAPKTTWYTGSPYLAAPLWPRVDPNDQVTRQALGWYAWNYSTSFSKVPLIGTGVDSIRIPVGEKPYPFQVAGVQRGVLRPKILLAEEPGLGKSLEALVIANMTRPERIVIGCPTGLAFNWAAECEKWLVDPRSITILNNPRKAVPERGVIILPYSHGHNFVEKLRGPTDLLIMDESHNLKNPSARRTAPWLGHGGFAEQAKRVVALTGTPVPNNPLEIHGLLRVLAPESVGRISRERFKELYCSSFKGKTKVAKKNGGVANVEFEKIDGANEDALNAELRASGVMVRRFKNDVLDQLPPKHVYLMHLSPTAEIEALVREEATLYDMLETKLLTSQELMAVQGHIAHVRARLGSLKAPKIADYVRSIFESGETRVILFMIHREAMEIVRKSFDFSGIKVRILSGSESPAARQAHVNAFQRPGGYELAIGQVTAAGVGLTMTAARYCVLGEIAWTPATNDQCIDRAHRISQTRQVEAPIITFPHAVEERVIRANAKKAISAQNILDRNLMSLFAA